MECRLSAETVANIIATLKVLDVRGFESIDRLVALVMLFEGLLSRSSTQKTDVEQVSKSN